MVRVYSYNPCSTCRKALRWLTDHGIAHEVLPIRETPPSIADLAIALKSAGGQVRKIFNTSGMDYRALNLKDRLPTLATDEALALLTKNGNLVKRPLLIHGQFALSGFNEAEWNKALASAIPPP